MNFVLKNLLIFIAGSAIVKASKSNRVYEKKTKSSLPDFRGVIEIKHTLPGRIRFYIPLLKHNENAQIILKSELRKIQTVAEVETNITTGSLVINYNRTKINPQLLLAIVIKLLNLEEDVLKKPVPKLGNEMKMLKDSMNMAIYNKSNGILDGSSLLVFILLISAIHKFYIGNGNKVGPVTCLMWALSYID